MICSKYQFCLPFLIEMHEEIMEKNYSVIGIGSVIFIFGLIFDLQGQSAIGPESSFMYANPNWITYGIGIMVVGITVIGTGIVLNILKIRKIRNQRQEDL